MNIGKPIAWIALLLFVANLVYPAAKRDWKQGRLTSVEVTDVPVTSSRLDHRYECVVSDGIFSYTVEYERKIKAAVHDQVKFVIDKDTFVLLDADGQERSARIEKRERVLVDSGDR